MRYLIELGVEWDTGSYYMAQNFRSRFPKGALNKAIEYAEKLPCAADRRAAGMKVRVSAEIKETMPC